ncbi:NACHT domain-containing protein [Bacillus cereus]|uniref:NACHT domain-containing protein n=1 Tax=Bacillus cereus TaxID=1396 RepID=UPI002570CBDD|nr:NACHT domain-containing protein [Bacillus cereus]WJE23051.1 NACHT domain-containing protein [Bacillus cereus]
MDDLITKTVITAASGIIAEPVKHILNTWLKPKLEELKQTRDINEKLETFAFDVFSEYLINTYQQNKYVNVIALGLQQIKLEDIYIPVKIYSDEKKEQIVVNGYDTEFVDKYQKIAIEDTAGMGKSTLMKKLFISSIEENAGIPIFIELKDLSEEKDIIDVILEKINQLKNTHSREFIIEVINKGDFIFFLDGYDEIPFQYQQSVTRQLKQFILNASHNTFFLTSRPIDSLYSFGQFQKFEIMELKKQEAFSLFQKFDNITQLDLSVGVIQHIEENLKSRQFSDLESFLGNPLLASFLYLTFKHKMDLPTVKIEFYEKVYDALFETHDLSKDSFKRDKHCGLSKRQMQKILMKLGFICLKENENDYDRNKLLKLIGEAKSSPYYKEVDEGLILTDLEETVPLFSRVGMNYKWSHKSFMEYFAAYAIDSGKRQEEVLTKIHNSINFPVYLNMLDFYYEIDRQMFDRIFVYPIVNQFIRFINASGINPNEDVNKLKYLACLFNRILVFERDSSVLKFKSDSRSRIDFEGTVDAMKLKHSKEIPEIANYSLHYGSSSSRKYCSVVLTKEKKIEHVLNLLINKNSKLVKTYSREEYRAFITNEEMPMSIICGWTNSAISNIDEIELDNRINLMLGLFGNIKGRGRSGITVIDYFTALEYKELIESEMRSQQENDIMLDF